ncbi:hypothetical protein QFZ22_007603 [Streptomyces canus]|uniref:Uncharacterized protein n=1 Tax=Streptomyces canus TaxID=58343 RepID=A0AAW8FS54_9ACTN|nr:hypothetical protein [Streptomyces canus]
MASSPSAPAASASRAVPYGERGAVSGARHHRHPPRRLLDGRADARLELLGRERVELPGAAAREHGSGPRRHTLAHMRAVGVEIDGAVGAVRRDREEQRPAGDAESVGEVGRRHRLSLERVEREGTRRN